MLLVDCGLRNRFFSCFGVNIILKWNKWNDGFFKGIYVKSRMNISLVEFENEFLRQCAFYTICVWMRSMPEFDIDPKSANYFVLCFIILFKGICNISNCIRVSS